MIFLLLSFWFSLLNSKFKFSENLNCFMSSEKVCPICDRKIKGEMVILLGKQTYHQACYEAPTSKKKVPIPKETQQNCGSKLKNF